MSMRKRTDTVPHYDLEALKKNLEKCERNIALCLSNGWHQSLQEELEDKAKLMRLIDEVEGKG